MKELPTLLEMLKAGVHFGHRTSKWHPKMAPYVFGDRNGIHIINLEETRKKLEESLNFVRNTAKAGGVILFVGTKRQAQQIIKEKALACGMPYVIERWLGGTITNFGIILKVIKKYRNLKEKKESGELEKYTKKEQLEFEREIGRLEKIVGGMATLKRLPDVIFILDVKKERIAVREVKKSNVKVLGICDTNSNPTGIDYIIPANDDATKSIEMMVGLVSEAISEGKKMAEAGKDEKKVEVKK